ncbi:hypothetical protein KSP39_PZI004404 [Platanthera zijinensis]|uniref:Uncharacterized protein n=1 Tax=Platanthera zijinensis TaxID=2320716 RepID=A0AAP0BXF9_9ASPA
MAPDARSAGDPPLDSTTDARSRRLEAQEQLVVSMHALLLALHTKIDSLHASTPAVSAASGSGPPADNNFLLVAGPQSIPSGTTPLPIPGRSALSLGIPSFAGVDPIGWIAKAEQYFDLNYTPEHDKVSTTVIGLDGSALHWAWWPRQTNTCLSWPELKQEMIRLYDTRYSGSSTIERLCGIR